jgi:SAM-dependent methyltransferase
VSDFDEYAGSYEREIETAIAFAGQDHAFFLELKADLLRELVRRHWGAPGEARLLDVGCGPGTMDAHLVPHVRSLVGVDTSPRMIAVAAAANPAARYEVSEPLHLPLEDGAVDVSFASCVLHHVSVVDQPAVVAEMCRVVAPGGLVVILEHNPLNPLTRLVVARCALDAGVVLFGPARARRLLERGGAVVVERRYVGFVPLRGQLVRRLERRVGALPFGAQYAVVGRRA